MAKRHGPRAAALCARRPPQRGPLAPGRPRRRAVAMGVRVDPRGRDGVGVLAVAYRLRRHLSRRRAFSRATPVAQAGRGQQRRQGELSDRGWPGRWDGRTRGGRRRPGGVGPPGRASGVPGRRLGGGAGLVAARLSHRAGAPDAHRSQPSARRAGGTGGGVHGDVAPAGSGGAAGGAECSDRSRRRWLRESA